MSLSGFNGILQNVLAETKLKDEWVKRTPRVWVKYPAIHPQRDGKNYRIEATSLGNVQAGELSGRKHVFRPGGGAWGKFELRIPTPEAEAELQWMNERIRQAHRDKEAFLKSEFWRFEDRLTWDDLLASSKPWTAFRQVLEAFRKGEASKADFQAAMDALYGEASP